MIACRTARRGIFRFKPYFCGVMGIFDGLWHKRTAAAFLLRARNFYEAGFAREISVNQAAARNLLCGADLIQRRVGSCFAV